MYNMPLAIDSESLVRQSLTLCLYSVQLGSGLRVGETRISSRGNTPHFSRCVTMSLLNATAISHRSQFFKTEGQRGKQGVQLG